MNFTDDNSLEERVELWKQAFSLCIKQLKINPILSWDVCHKNLSENYSHPFIIAKIMLNNFSVEIISYLDNDLYWMLNIKEGINLLGLKTLQALND